MLIFQTSKPIPFGRTSKSKHTHEVDSDQYSSSVAALNHQQSKLSKKHSLTKDKVRRGTVWLVST